jgi:hypothetical protein
MAKEEKKEEKRIPLDLLRIKDMNMADPKISVNNILIGKVAEIIQKHNMLLEEVRLIKNELELLK